MSDLDFIRIQLECEEARKLMYKEQFWPFKRISGFMKRLGRKRLGMKQLGRGRRV